MEGAGRVVIYGDYDVDGACPTALAMELALNVFNVMTNKMPLKSKLTINKHSKALSSKTVNIHADNWSLSLQ